eukprot:1880581-Pleurochrysis_carterae.AAC.3
MFSAMRFAALSLALLLLGVSYSAAMAHPHTASLVGSRFARCGLCRSAAVKCCDGEMDGVVDGDEDPVVRSCTPMRSHFVVSGTGQPLPERFEMKVPGRCQLTASWMPPALPCSLSKNPNSPSFVLLILSASFGTFT